MLFVLLTGLFVMQIVALTLFSAIFTLMITIVVWFMVKDNCKEMSQYCLLMFGMMCGIQAVFDTIILLSMVGGRREQETTRTQVSNSEVHYVTEVKTYPFFDESRGTIYNLQSFCRILSPVVLLLCTLLAYKSYHCYDSELFNDDAPAAPVRGGGGGGQYGGAGNGGGNPYGGRARPGQGAGRPTAQGPSSLFQ